LNNAKAFFEYDKLKSDHFYFEEYRNIWETMRQLAIAGRNIDVLNIRRESKTLGKEVSGLRLAELSSQDNFYHFFKLGGPDASFVQDQLITMWKNRELVRVGEAITRSEIDLDSAMTQLGEISSNAKGKTAEEVSEISIRVLDEVEAAVRACRNNEPLPNAVYFGVDSIDRKGGSRAGDFIIVAGRPGMGKSTIMRHSMMHNAGKFPVLGFTKEMTKEQIVSLMASTKAGIVSQDVRGGRVSDQEIARFQTGISHVSAMNMTFDYITDLSGTISSIRRWRMATDMSKPAIVYIDYLQQIINSKPGRSRNDEVAGVSNAMKELCLLLNLTIYAAAQLSRGVESRGGDKRPGLSDLRDSGEVEQDADAVYFLYRPEYYGYHQFDDGSSTEGALEVIIAKNRHGATGSALTTIDLPTGRIAYEENSTNNFAPF
jgi:replicative DNA helicase